MPNICTKQALSSLKLHHKYEFCSDARAPLFFLIHGRAGNFDVMWTFRRTLPEHCNIIAAQAPLPDPLGGFSWWSVDAGDPQGGATQQTGPTGSLEEIQKSSTLLTAFMNATQEFYRLRPVSISALGFSQGAGVCSLISQYHPSLLSKLGLLAGFVIRTNSKEIALASDKASVLMAHGTKDDRVPYQRALSDAEWLQQQGFNVEFVSDDVGHKVGSNGMRRLRDWLTT